MTGIDAAIALACRVHAGQVDKAGQPYILHPLRLVSKLHGTDERIVAVLHDVVEDSGVTLDDFRQNGFSDAIVCAIDCLTRRVGESYESFIARLSANMLARKVKIEDIKDNLDLTRLGALSNEDLSRVKKYHWALQYLLMVL